MKKITFSLFVVFNFLSLTAQKIAPNKSHNLYDFSIPQNSGLDFNSSSGGSSGGVVESIPLYVLPGRQSSAGVGLVYNAGVNVDSRASAVGQNWGLQTGGSISRQTMGHPDEFYVSTNTNNEAPQGFLMLGDKVKNYAQEDYKDIIKNDELGYFDLQPDIFTMTIGGGNEVSFVFDTNGKIKVIGSPSLVNIEVDYEWRKFFHDVNEACTGYSDVIPSYKQNVPNYNLEEFIPKEFENNFCNVTSVNSWKLARTIKGFTVTDGSGKKYKFGYKKTAQDLVIRKYKSKTGFIADRTGPNNEQEYVVHNYGEDFPPYKDFDPLEIVWDQYQSEKFDRYFQITKWHLISVESPNNGEGVLEFEYEGVGFEQQGKNVEGETGEQFLIGRTSSTENFTAPVIQSESRAEKIIHNGEEVWGIPYANYAGGGKYYVEYPNLKPINPVTSLDQYGIELMHKTFSINDVLVYGYYKRLKKIESSYGSINFIYNHERDDIKGSQALTQIDIKDHNNNIIRTFYLEYEYKETDVENDITGAFQLSERVLNYWWSSGFILDIDVNDNRILKDTEWYDNAIQAYDLDFYPQEHLFAERKRLFLKKLWSTASDDCTVPPYVFDYYEGSIPRPFSPRKAKDNLANANTFKPWQIPDIGMNGHVYFGYTPNPASNNPKDIHSKWASLDDAIVGSLKKITYPLGGTKEYVYQFRQRSDQIYGRETHGLIVSKVTTCTNDESAPCMTAEYEYDNSVMVGRTKRYNYTFSKLPHPKEFNKSNNAPGWQNRMEFIQASSSPFSSGFIVYENVTVRNPGNGYAKTKYNVNIPSSEYSYTTKWKNGSTKNTHAFIDCDIATSTGNCYFPPDPFPLQKTYLSHYLPLEMTEHKEDGSLVSKTTRIYDYIDKEDPSVKGISANLFRYGHFDFEIETVFSFNISLGNGIYPPPFGNNKPPMSFSGLLALQNNLEDISAIRYTTYSFIKEEIRVKESTTEYFGKEAGTYKTKYDYKYNDDGLIEEVVLSEGGIPLSKSTIGYASSSDNVPSFIKDQMENKNIMVVPVSSATYRSNVYGEWKPISGSNMILKSWNGRVLPENMTSFNNKNGSKSDVSILDYDAYGRPKEVQDNISKVKVANKYYLNDNYLRETILTGPDIYKENTLFDYQPLVGLNTSTDVNGDISSIGYDNQHRVNSMGAFGITLETIEYNFRQKFNCEDIGVDGTLTNEDENDFECTFNNVNLSVNDCKLYLRGLCEDKEITINYSYFYDIEPSHYFNCPNSYVGNISIEETENYYAFTQQQIPICQSPSNENAPTMLNIHIDIFDENGDKLFSDFYLLEIGKQGCRLH